MSLFEERTVRLGAMSLGIISLILTPLFLTGCARNREVPKAEVMEIERDVHSFSHPDEVVVTNLDLDATVDFDKKLITGKAGLDVSNKTGAAQLYLDTRDLAINRVTLDDGSKEAKFSLGDMVQYLGRPLVIDILPDTSRVNIEYTTSPDAAAVQWLAPAQTAGGKKPFLFTQSQAILARTWVPCQDSPGVRMTYKAKIHTPPDLMAVMSATNPQKRNDSGVYEFQMRQPVPSYLLALAVGDIEFRPLGNRSGVYGEPAVVEKAAYEFADLEKMIAAAESLYGPYRWERYDVIVLPPSFPFGGMENPRLTFATPTVIAGDRSLVSLIAHELAHSWSGNLVTNATWNDFWLNEGFTVYFERRIMEAIHGRDYSEMLAELGYQDLVSTINEIGKESPDTQLHLSLSGRDPDDGMSDIAYEKGYFFLRLMEETVGRDKWDAFLKEYFNTFAFQSMTTGKFLDYMREHLLKGDRAADERLEIDRWVYGAGLPDNCPKVESREFAKVETQAKAFLAGAAPTDLDTGGWTSHHWLHFLRQMPPKMTDQQLATLDGAYHFTDSGNSEILNEWFLHAIPSDYKPAYPALERFLTSMGRRKFLKPLYTKLAETPEGLERARLIYKKARPGYHSVSFKTIDEILKWRQ